MKFEQIESNLRGKKYSSFTANSKQKVSSALLDNIKLSRCNGIKQKYNKQNDWSIGMQNTTKSTPFFGGSVSNVGWGEGGFAGGGVQFQKQAPFGGVSFSLVRNMRGVKQQSKKKKQ